MSKKKLGMVHTSTTLVPVFAQLCGDKLPGVELFNIVDDSLVKGIMAAGCITPQISQRVANYLQSAEAAGADHILVTCSSIGPAVEAAAPGIKISVHRVDQPMADHAIESGKRIGVIATQQTTLDPTTDLIQRRADKAGKDIMLTSRLCEGAFEALMSGQAGKHDAMVAGVLKELTEEVDVIVLAQASMARVVDSLTPAEKRVPILASPNLAVDYLATIM